MGYGHFVLPTDSSKPAELDLFISFQWTPVANLDEWRNVFEWASAMLEEATDGRIRLGRVVYAENASLSGVADVWVFDQDMSATAHGGRGLRTWDVHIQLGTDNIGEHDSFGLWKKGTPGQIVHEIGHLAFGLGEEYEPGRCMPSQAMAQAAGCCVMEFGRLSMGRNQDGSGEWPALGNPVTEFCNDTNHEQHTQPEATNQSTINTQWSCAKTIFERAKQYYPGLLSAPFADPAVAPTTPAPVKHTITWIPVALVERFAVVLDVSASMQGRKAIAGVKYGAEFWVDLETILRNELAVVSYATAANPDVPRSQLTPGDAAAARSKIRALDAIGPSTNIRAGLQVADAEIVPDPTAPPAAQEVMVFFSDGQHNEGPDMEESDITSINAIVHSFGFRNVDQSLMFDIGTKTGGSYRFIQDPGDQPDAHLEIATELSAIAADTHSGLVAFRRVVLPPPVRWWSWLWRWRRLASDRAATAPVPSSAVADLSAAEALNRSPTVKSAGFDLPVFIEEQSLRATFVMQRRVETDVSLLLFRPNGQMVEPTDSDVECLDLPDQPHSLCVVDGPQAGVWTMRASRGDTTGYVHVTMFAVSENPNITAGVVGTSQLYEVGEEIRLEAQVANKYQLTGVNTTIRSEPRPMSSPLCRFLSRFGWWRWFLRLRLVRWLLSLFTGAITPRPFTEEREGRGWYVVSLPGFDNPGSYDLIAEFSSDGSAAQALDPILAAQAGVPLPAAEVRPAFRRIRRFQVHVGPLPRGEDTD